MQSLLKYIILIIFLSSCGERTEKVVSDKYPDGTPKVVEYYKTTNDVKKLIKQNSFYQDKKLQAEGGVKNNKMDGKWTYYYNNGKKWSEGFFREGIEDGTHTTWYDNGNKRYEGKFKNGKRIGKWTFWDDKGKVIKVITSN